MRDYDRWNSNILQMKMNKLKKKSKLQYILHEKLLFYMLYFTIFMVISTINLKFSSFSHKNSKNEYKQTSLNDWYVELIETLCYR